VKELRRVLVANRGEIAVRLVCACRKLGIESLLVASEADLDSLAARLADRTICIGPPPARASYLNAEAIVHAAVASRCDAIHPGYGFLSENARFAELCEANGVTFVGPAAHTMRALGDKLQAREIARNCGVPLLPGSRRVNSAAEADALAAKIGYPVLFKASAGGGGRGMKVAGDTEALHAAFPTASAEALSAFGDPTLYVERFVARARHVEVQILGDGAGNVIHLGERDCSTQRRYQKIVEESPAPALAPHLREGVRAAAVALAREARYSSAGTVEFLVDPAGGKFYFLEVNTRIQVEHPVTEMVTGIDIVAEQLRIASGRGLSIDQSEVRMQGHAIEARINAESPSDGFRPSPGRITAWQAPAGDGIRVDTHCFPGYVVPPYYDSLLAKLIVVGRDREEAIEALQAALGSFVVEGVATTIPFLLRLLDEPAWREAAIHTRWAEELLQAEPTDPRVPSGALP